MSPIGNLESAHQARRITRLLVIGISLALVATWVSIGYFAIESREARIAEEQRVLARIARVVQEQTHSLFSLIDYFLVSADLWFQNHPEADPRHDPDFLALVATFRAKTNGLANIRLVSATGGLYYLGKTGNEPLADVSDRDYYQAQMQPATQGFFIAKPVLSRVTGLWGLPISYPLKSAPNGMAVLFAAIENRVLTQPFEDARTRPNGTIIVSHRDSTVLFHSPDEMAIGKSMGNSELWRERLPVAPEGGYRVKKGTLDGRPRIVAYNTVPDYPLVVIASSVTDEVLEDWQNKTFALFGLGALATFCCLLVLWRLKLSVTQFESIRRKFEEQANTDDLTQIPNRRYFVRQSTSEIERSLRYRRELSLLIYDVDHFKEVNDAFGHETGDQLLKSITEAVNKELRTTDMQGRLGGEEFGVVLPETNKAEAFDVAERLRKRVEDLVLHGQDGSEIHVTVSIGISELPSHGETLDQLMSRADKALYQAKESGRNRVAV